MKNIEEKLKLKKLDIDNIEIPDDLEGRLRSALSLVEIKTQKPSHKLSWFLRHKMIAVVIMLVAVMSVLNYDVFAYYGKKIIGYDKLTSGSLKVLNELGKGQKINKSYKFKNGSEVILDGVMFDKNKLTLMYRFIGENQDKIEDLSISSLKGYFKTYSMSSGHGVVSNDKKEVNG